MINWLTIVFILLCELCISLTAYGQFGGGDSPRNPLVGKTGVSGPATIEGVDLNPAQAADLSTHVVSLPLDINYRTFLQRSPGFAANKKTGIELDGLPLPNYVYKLNKNIGLFGILVPLPLSMSIEKENIPVVIFNQENKMSLRGKVSLNFLANMLVGWRIDEKIGAGVSLRYASMGGVFDASASEVGSPLFSIDAEMSRLVIDAGVKYSHSGFLMGLSVGLFASNQSDLKITSSLLESLKPGSGNSESQKNVQSFLNPIRFGVSKKVLPRLLMSGELKYERAQKYREFSLVDLQEKDKDTYDTLSIYLGGTYALNQNETFLAGYYYEPGAIGAGGVGASSKAGYGLMDSLGSLGAPPSKPEWALSVGYRKYLSKNRQSRFKKQKSERARPAAQRYGVEVGFSYAETSIGIPSEGEQPGAYFVRNIRIPLRLFYIF